MTQTNKELVEAAKAIPKAELVRARKAFCRQIASVIVGAMSTTGMSFEDIAARLPDRTEKQVRKFVLGLIEGKSGRHGLSKLSDICFAMNVVPIISFVERRTALQSIPDNIQEGGK